MAVQADNDWLRHALARLLLRLLLLLLHHDAGIVRLLSAEEVVVNLDGRGTPIDSILFADCHVRLRALSSRSHRVIIATLSQSLSDVEQLINACHLLASLVVCVRSAHIRL